VAAVVSGLVRGAVQVLITAVAITSAAVVGYLAAPGHTTSAATPAPTPRPLERLGTPKDLCCCRWHADGETDLSEALEDYARAKGRGDHREACLKASCAVEEYNRAVKGSLRRNSADLASLEHWREIERAECAAGGYVPCQH
jgi:hypothetical protein